MLRKPFSHLERRSKTLVMSLWTVWFRLSFQFIPAGGKNYRLRPSVQIFMSSFFSTVNIPSGAIFYGHKTAIPLIEGLEWERQIVESMGLDYYSGDRPPLCAWSSLSFSSQVKAIYRIIKIASFYELGKRAGMILSSPKMPFFRSDLAILSERATCIKFCMKYCHWCWYFWRSRVCDIYSYDRTK